MLRVAVEFDMYDSLGFDSNYCENLLAVADTTINFDHGSSLILFIIIRIIIFLDNDR